MATYRVRPVHRITPRDSDILEAVEIPDGCFSDPRKLGAALRAARVLPPGTRLREMRVEGATVVAFPDRGVWHSVMIGDVNGTPAKGL